MKKLRLKALSLGAREILSREQLKSITGGCNTMADCPVDYFCDWGGACVYGGMPGSGSGGTIGDTCGKFWDPGDQLYHDLCPTYTPITHLFAGCLDCRLVV